VLLSSSPLSSLCARSPSLAAPLGTRPRPAGTVPQRRKGAGGRTSGRETVRGARAQNLFLHGPPPPLPLLPCPSHLRHLPRALLVVDPPV
jgi:hypothetical protein